MIVRSLSFNSDTLSLSNVKIKRFCVAIKPEKILTEKFNEYMRKELGSTEEYTIQRVHNKVDMLTSKGRKICHAKPPPTGSGTGPEERTDLAAAKAR